ncbi:DUF1934 domain-containing protein [Clostridium hydrogeniformans]|uniref:DUF1934 domain-containing protein n=1 Tax=Clostridium hydrogeniformans TaxID=349933 RepID=UPI000487025D|nr:DUF1934 domain-containing protein [Clostridium hydrogeniformans]
MIKKAVVSIKSSQDISDEAIEVVTPGEFTVLSNGFKAEYNETELSGMEGTITILNIFEDYLELIREGSTACEMKFEKGKENISLYNTPYGGLELKTKTKKLDIVIDENGGKIFVEYELSVTGQSPYTTVLDIEIKA